ncbi:hypothetical protein [Luteimonas sp. A649]
MASKHIGWWYYFWFFAANLVASSFSAPVDTQGFVSLLLGIVGLLGLWGHLRSRPIGHRHLWTTLFFALLLVMGYYVARPFFVGVQHTAGVVFGAAIGTLVTAPLLLALWRYSFRSPEIWRRTTAA